MNAKLQNILLLLLCLALFSSPIVLEAKEGSGEVQQKDDLGPDKEKFREDMRKLWTDQVVWTRNYIVSAVGGLPDQANVQARLQQNQLDMVHVLKTFYGEEAGNQMWKLLQDHFLIAGKMIEAAKSQNRLDVKTYSTDWYQNADDIANLLSGLNTNWSLNELRDLLHTHLQLISDSVTARIDKEWDMDIAALDKGTDQITELADVLADGIIKQFPDRF